MGLVGVEMVGRRGEPSMLLMKVEKVPFFLPLSSFLFFAPSPSSLYRLRGLLVPDGGVSILRESCWNDVDWRRRGDFLNREGLSCPSAVCECTGPGGRSCLELCEDACAPATMLVNESPTSSCPEGSLLLLAVTGVSWKPYAPLALTVRLSVSGVSSEGDRRRLLEDEAGWLLPAAGEMPRPEL